MPQHYELDIDGFHVTVILKSIKNIYLRVKPPLGTVEVTAPYYVHQSDIEKAVSSRADWIDTARDQLLLAHKNHRKENLLTGWTPQKEKEAKEILEAKVPRLLEKWRSRIDKQPTHITYRRMKTRWGSCTPKTGRIRLNLALAFAPDELLEYVLVHELTHLYERGHGEGFRARMDAYLPDWRAKRRALNSYGSYELHF
ncbi:M48 family metallopeptidase [Alloscardovia sp. HMSC034E08]|uniref:M48 family metallopeptidase n=1 Tax=Alloscardovia sp. HMSC034E08 TaxID=1739413 RepID=UPI0008D07053|nr:SprT-like domain-containing protein [Alloscardovia sp. HMSC034E08]OFQ98328.1 metal-dependent hydrolase [Alloscardovia sp. HMSC034E08]